MNNQKVYVAKKYFSEPSFDTDFYLYILCVVFFFYDLKIHVIRTEANNHFSKDFNWTKNFYK